MSTVLSGFAGVLILIWLVIGVIATMMAGLTYKFEERFFSPAFLIPCGPLAFWLWLYMESRERKKGNE